MPKLNWTKAAHVAEHDDNHYIVTHDKKEGVYWTTIIREDGFPDHSYFLTRKEATDHAQKEHEEWLKTKAEEEKEWDED